MLSRSSVGREKEGESRPIMLSRSSVGREKERIVGL
jgi:hypothetical protein